LWTSLGVTFLVLSFSVALAAGAQPKPEEEKAPSAATPETAGPTVFELLERGGPLMYAIYAASVLTVTFAIERVVSLRQRRILPPSFARDFRRLLARRPIEQETILKYCNEHQSPAARIFRTAVKRLKRPLPEVEKAIEDAGAKEARLLRRNTRVLFGVASVAPLLGLLGTVLGMISAFRDISGGEALGKADVLASGIYEALVTTAAGLTVAIPSLVLGLLFNAKIEKLIVKLDDLALEFVDTLLEPEGDTKRKPRVA
jgi:biopolymer transport protein ExbB